MLAAAAVGRSSRGLRSIRQRGVPGRCGLHCMKCRIRPLRARSTMCPGVFHAPVPNRLQLSGFIESVSRSAGFAPHAWACFVC